MDLTIKLRLEEIERAQRLAQIMTEANKETAAKLKAERLARCQECGASIKEWDSAEMRNGAIVLTHACTCGNKQEVSFAIDWAQSEVYVR